MASMLARLLGRPTGDTQRPALTAAARRLSIARNPSDGTQALRRAEAWQDSAFGLYDALGEVHGAFSLFGNALSRVRMGPAWRVHPDEDPIPLQDALELEDASMRPSQQLVNDALATWEALELNPAVTGLANQGGVRGLLSEHGAHLGLVGETVLWGHDVNGTEHWEALSVRELVQRNGRWEVVRTPAARKGEPVGEDDFLLRIWRPHPGWSDLADSSLRPLLDEGELMLLLQSGDLSIARSRIANSGILYVDSTLDFGPADPTGDEATDVPFIEELVAEASAAILNPASASATVPLVVTGEGKLDDRIAHIALPRAMDAINMDRMEQAVRRLAMGIDLPPELVTGKGDLNHWTAWQVDESTAKVHVEPTVVIVDEAYANGYLVPRMIALDSYQPQELRRLTVWHDLTDLVVPPDRSGDAHRAYQEFALSTDAYLDAIGFSREDVPDNDELSRRLLIRAAIVLAQGTGQVPDPDDLESGRLPPPADGPPAPSGPPSGEQAAALLQAAMDLRSRERIEVLPALTAGGTEPLDQLAEDLHDLDVALLERLAGAADAAARRVLEKAGARIVSSARRDRASAAAIRDVPKVEVAATLGRQRVAQLGLSDQDLIGDSLEGMRDDFDRLVDRTQQAALEQVAAVVELDEAEWSEVRQEQAADRAEAWEWLAGALTSHLLGLLYDPNPRAPAEGEVDPDAKVPFQLLREAAARAGGATRAAASRAVGRGMDVLIELTGRGAATGVRVLNLLAAGGIVEAGLRWVYGPLPRNTFLPHLNLDGGVFESMSDPGLLVAGDFPRTSYYHPGDHSGCRCTWVPVLRRRQEPPA